MFDLLILSGKGGTGKTTIASSFISLLGAKAYADCDVDAPNLHLITNIGDKPIEKDFYGMQKAFIDKDNCIECGLCIEACRFDAIFDNFIVNEYACEGCALCEFVCPTKCIRMNDDVAGFLDLYKNDRVFSTATLKMGRGNSGLLVTEVKKQMKNNIDDYPIAIIDGSPGIGCPVIASLSGVDMVLIVAEPSLSGFSDMERIIKTARGFKLRSLVCINKYDTNVAISNDIESYCKDKGIGFVGKIPFDAGVVEAVNKGIALTDTDTRAGKAIKEVFENTMRIIRDGN